MKTNIIYILLVLNLSFVNAQNYKSAFRSDVCNCLEEESLKRVLTENAFKRCLRETLPKYATQIDASIIEEDTQQKFLKGQLARKDLLLAMPSELIYSCDVYYKHINFLRTSSLLIMRENAKEDEIEKYDQMVALTPSATAYFMRAKVHFKLGNIKETEADIAKSLELNPNSENTISTRHELMLLAWVLEEQERYKEAIEIYDKVYFGALDSEVAKLRALADKKSGGTIANIPVNVTVENKENSNVNSRIKTVKVNRTDNKSTPSTKVKKDSTSLKKIFKL
tara:strand:+ start:1132 stop:1974 length:843 start_codon:yes stop_codon:yes gene_type:complete